jgi:DNA-binding IclR family transcriptional regulator
LPDSDINEVLEANDARLSSYGGMTTAALRDLIRSTRERGYSVIPDYAVAGVTGVGRALLDRTGRPPAAISVSTVSERMDKARQHTVSPILKQEVNALC